MKKQREQSGFNSLEESQVHTQRYRVTMIEANAKCFYKTSQVYENTEQNYFDAGFLTFKRS